MIDNASLSGGRYARAMDVYPSPTPAQSSAAAPALERTPADAKAVYMHGIADQQDPVSHHVHATHGCKTRRVAGLVQYEYLFSWKEGNAVRDIMSSVGDWQHTSTQAMAYRLGLPLSARQPGFREERSS